MEPHVCIWYPNEAHLYGQSLASNCVPPRRLKPLENRIGRQQLLRPLSWKSARVWWLFARVDNFPVWCAQDWWPAIIGDEVIYTCKCVSRCSRPVTPPPPLTHMHTITIGKVCVESVWIQLKWSAVPYFMQQLELKLKTKYRFRKGQPQWDGGNWILQGLRVKRKYSIPTHTHTYAYEVVWQ